MAVSEVSTEISADVIDALSLAKPAETLKMSFDRRSGLGMGSMSTAAAAQIQKDDLFGVVDQLVFLPHLPHSDVPSRGALSDRAHL